MKTLQSAYWMALLILGCCHAQLYAQQAYGIGTQQPNASALLHLESTNRGLLIPVMSATNVHTISNPGEGLLLYDATNQRLRFRRTFSWAQLPDGTPTRRWLLTGVDFENQEDYRIGTNSTFPIIFRNNNQPYGLIGYGQNAGVYIGRNTGSTLALNDAGTVGYGEGAGGAARLSVGLGIRTAAAAQGSQTGLVAIGANAMRYAGGSQHVAIGAEAYEGLQMGGTNGALPNIAVGPQSLRNATTAGGNIALGNQAMLTATTAQGNIGIRSQTNGTRNILINSANADGTDQILIGNGVEFTGGTGNIIFLGSGTLNQKYTSSHNIMINTGNPNTLLTTDAEEVILGGTSLANPPLVNPTLSTRNEGAHFTANRDVRNKSVMLGYNALQSQAGEMGVGIGAEGVRVGTSSVAVGSLAETGTGSVAVGYRATGYDNSICIGWDAGQAGFGNDNVILGSGAKNNNAVGDRSNQMILGNTNMTTWLFGRNTTATNRALLVGTTTSNGNGAGLTSTGAWMSTSDVNTKEEFSQLNKTEILDKLVGLSVTRWRYKGTNEYHIGPMAQDFYAAFGLGNSDKHISVIDPAGLTTLAIQAMMERMAALEAELEALEKE